MTVVDNSMRGVGRLMEAAAEVVGNSAVEVVAVAGSPTEEVAEVVR